ncbi:hypothetical protein [Microcoleus sp. OTE_8_concoct_300]|uniref:hypothetical protein n=1 Tax=Microcoleus sp. OTE_8_concoct_300 TaxID=2964710 RepID=UPI00403F3FF8
MPNLKSQISNLKWYDLDAGGLTSWDGRLAIDNSMLSIASLLAQKTERHLNN